ncbi:MAG: type II toxin-antitoxin system Phd/YefM family antitoxin [Paracoccaceae bacterium]
MTYIIRMKHATSTELSANLSAMMAKVNDDHEPLIVTRARGRPVVVISLEDHASADETAYLLASPADARALRTAIVRLDNAEDVTRSIEELEAMTSE